MGIIDKCMQHCDCTIHEISRGGVGTQLMRGDVMKTQKALSGALLNTCKTRFILCNGEGCWLWKSIVMITWRLFLMNFWIHTRGEIFNELKLVYNTTKRDPIKHQSPCPRADFCVRGVVTYASHIKILLKDTQQWTKHSNRYPTK